jgi:CheY-like chemotaxis protein
MEVASAPGRGSRFTLVAPRRLGAQACAPPAADAAPGQGATRVAGRMGLLFATGLRTRVLLADDHNVVRQGLAALLQEQPDIEIVGQAADGQQAVELARALRPDVVIMDVSMPRLSGIEATRQIVAEWPHVRVIALSMHEEADMATSMKRVGAAAYLTKGGPPEALMEAVRGRPAKGD